MTSHDAFTSKLLFSNLLLELIHIPWYQPIRRFHKIKEIDAFAKQHNECCELDWKGWKDR